MEACASDNYTYDIEIDPSSLNENEILIDNFGNFRPAVRALVNGNNLSIPQQSLNVGGTSVIISNGSGSINGNILVISYAYAIGTDTENCSMTCSKQ